MPELAAKITMLWSIGLALAGILILAIQLLAAPALAPSTIPWHLHQATLRLSRGLIRPDQLANARRRAAGRRAMFAPDRTLGVC
jgi:hypothetical protein